MKIPSHIFFPSILISLLSVLASCKHNKEDARGGGGQMMELKAEGFVVQTGAFRHTYSTGGNLLPNEEIEIHPEMSGRVTALHFREGSRVSAGQVLVNLYDADIHAQVRKLKSQRALQQNLLKRQKDLLAIGGISQQEFETTETQIESINADIAAQDAQLRRTSIVAPFDGIIGIRNISLGAVVSPETVIASLRQVHPLKLDFTIPDLYRSSLAIGQEISFVLEEGLDTFSGKITAIEPGTDQMTRSVRVRALVPNAAEKLSPGAFVHVNITLESNTQALLVPAQSIIPTTRDKKLAVVKQGKAELRTVKLGERTEDKVEILQGISAGDTILTTALMQVKPGSAVKIVKMKE